MFNPLVSHHLNDRPQSSGIVVGSSRSPIPDEEMVEEYEEEEEEEEEAGEESEEEEEEEEEREEESEEKDDSEEADEKEEDTREILDQGETNKIKKGEDVTRFAAGASSYGTTDKRKEEEARRVTAEGTLEEGDLSSIAYNATEGSTANEGSIDIGENVENDGSTANDGSLRDSRPTAPPYEKLAQKNPKPTDHLAITIGPPIIIFFDIIVPCIIYYVWYDIKRKEWEDSCLSYSTRGAQCPTEKPQYEKHILGYAIISFGFGELYILIARVWRLVAHRDLCAPLLSRAKWELDATSWVYGVAMILALIPFVIGAELEIPQLYLYSPSFLMAFLGILMVLTLIPVKIPIGVNSHARGTRMRPFIYYAAEDFIAVDGLQDREFRVRYNARYDSSKQFRRMFLVLTFWWIFGVMVYIGCVSAIIWKLEFHHAFGSSFGVLFAYIIIWAMASYFYVDFDMDRQKKAHEAMVAKC